MLIMIVIIINSEEKKKIGLLATNLLSFMPFLLQTRQFLPTKKILAVERVDESAFQKPNVFQVVSKDYDDTVQILYLAAQVGF